MIHKRGEGSAFYGRGPRALRPTLLRFPRRPHYEVTSDWFRSVRRIHSAVATPPSPYHGARLCERGPPLCGTVPGVLLVRAQLEMVPDPVCRIECRAWAERLNTAGASIIETPQITRGAIKCIRWRFEIMLSNRLEQPGR